MGAAIWSSSLQEMRRFPLPLFLRFFENHGLLDIRDRPQWYVVPGGSREYVRALLARLGDRLTCASTRRCSRWTATRRGHPAAGVRGGAF
jgi:predicted NAD/FAD-binding protein